MQGGMGKIPLMFKNNTQSENRSGHLDLSTPGKDKIEA